MHSLKQVDTHGDNIYAENYAEWAERKIGLTATVIDGFDDIDEEKKIRPTY